MCICCVYVLVFACICGLGMCLLFNPFYVGFWALQFLPKQVAVNCTAIKNRNNHDVFFINSLTGSISAVLVQWQAGHNMYAQSKCTVTVHGSCLFLDQVISCSKHGAFVIVAIKHHMYTRVRARAHTHTNTHTHTHTPHANTHIPVYTHTHTYTIFTHMHIHSYTQKHTYTQTHIHCAQTHSRGHLCHDQLSFSKCENSKFLAK